MDPDQQCSTKEPITLGGTATVVVGCTGDRRDTVFGRCTTAVLMALVH